MSSNNSTLATILGTTLAVGTLSSLGWYYYFTSKQKEQQQQQQDLVNRRMSQPQQHVRSYENFKPPFPLRIRKMLSKCRLAYLSTIDAEFSSSHLSLMRFTYLHDPEDGEIVIMSTNRKTKKFDMLQQQKGVALLVHDFVNSDEDEEDCTYSITLNGTCRILPFGAPKTEHYRQAHLEHNPDYPQFIVGEDIEILCIDVSSARICDIQDRVIKWDVQDAAANATAVAADATGPNVVSKDLVHVSYQDLQTVLGGNDPATMTPSAMPRGGYDATRRVKYSEMSKVLSSAKLDALNRLLDTLSSAFGPDGLGFLEVTDLPPVMVSLRTKLLPMAEKLAMLTKRELVQLERPDVGWTIGWSHGKERFKDNTYDMAKGSFYVNPFFDDKGTNPNVYPSSLQPRLEEDLMTMTRFMSQVGMQIGTLCDLYLQREEPETCLWMISESLASGLQAKARLLYYFPKKDQPQLSATQAPVFDDWCGQHKDHSSITALLPGMLCQDISTGKEDKTKESTSTNDPYPPGLYIETRQKELVHASLAPTSLGFQLGETLQIMSRGRFRATPHSVKAPTSAAARAVGRASLAVFLQPLPHQTLPPLPPTGDGEAVDDVFSLRSRWRSTFGEFQKATTDTFN